MATSSTVGSPIYLGKPITEVWGTDCKGYCNRIKCPNRLNVFAKEDEKDKKQKNKRHVKRCSEDGKSALVCEFGDGQDPRCVRDPEGKAKA
jgi:hypothetical protein